jgi:subtilisin family serine protease
MSKLPFLLTSLALAALLLGCGGSQPELQSPGAVQTAPDSGSDPMVASRIPITSLDQLPQHSYELDGSASALLQDAAAFATFADAVRADLEHDLNTYQLEDRATLQEWYGTMANLEVLDGDWDRAVVYLDKVKTLEEKEAVRLTGGQTVRALAAAHARLGPEPDPAALQAEFRRQFAERIDPLPWDVVQDTVEKNKGRAEYLSENLLLGVVQANMDPVVAQTGAVGSDLARALVGMRVALTTIIPVKEPMVAVYADYIDANRVEKTNIWPARDVALPDGDDVAPVMLGIWDSGLDAAVFGAQVYTNEDERPDGIDNDRNGFVDDIHGIAFDVNGVYSVELLHPLDDQADKVEAARGYMQGFQDLQASVDSEAAARVRDKLSEMPPSEVEGFMTSLSFYGLLAHGTHVAGITLAGNPHASVLAARITFDYRNPPQAMTRAIARNHADSYRRTTAYFAEHGVRAVNMSWGWTFKEIESSLEANGVGAGPEERARMAREMLDILAEGLREAMAATPGILYCVAAGNSDSDVEFDVSIPANFELENMIVVGAVDQAGDPTDFTSGGRNVRVYANGFEVESDVPGGHRMAMSGTSMASPQVCNLAGKLLAVDPELTPGDLIRLIEEGADPHPDHPEMLLLNPRQSLLLAKAAG